MKDYYTKKKAPATGAYLRLAHGSLLVGIIALPGVIFPYAGIILGAVAVTLAILSFYNGEGYRAGSAKAGLILGMIAIFISFMLVYASVYVISHPEEFTEIYRSVMQ